MRKILLFISLSFSVICNAQNGMQDSIAFHQSFIEEGNNKQIISRATVAASPNGSFTVGGNSSTYYPVVFRDNLWTQHRATILEVGRSNTHTNSEWNGSLIASFKFHATNWGHGSSFIDADIKQTNVNQKPFIGGWFDATSTAGMLNIIIWFRGSSTYFYKSNCDQSPIVTNSSVIVEGKTYNIKEQIDDYVNNDGQTISRNFWVLGNSYFKGNVGIGTSNPQYKLEVAGNSSINNLQLGKQISPSQPGEITRMSIIPYKHTGGPWNFISRDTQSQAYLDINYANYNALSVCYYAYETRIGIGVKYPTNKLDVAGTIRATEVKVEAAPWADFVFDKEYKLPSLKDVESHIEEHKHLPGIPSESEVKENGGVGLGEMQVKLLQKIEELTLYVIEQNKEIQIIKEENLDLKKQINYIVNN